MATSDWQDRDGPVLFYSTSFLQSRHNAALLSLINEVKRAGREALLLACDGDLLTCAPNPEHLSQICSECRVQQQHNLRITGSDIRVVRLELQDIPQVCRPESTSRLYEFTYKGMPLGRSVANDFVFRARDVGFEVDPIVQDSVKESLGYACALFDAAQRVMADHSVTDVLVLNGRRSFEAPVAMAAQALGIRVRAFEGHRVDGRPQLIAAAQVQDLDARKEDLKSTLNRWAQQGGLSPELHSEVELILGAYVAGTSPLPNQRTFVTSEPVSLDPELAERPLVVIFSSSAWERYGIPGYGISPETRFGYRDLAELIDSVRRHCSWSIVVRWHPNLKNAGPGERALMQEVEIQTAAQDVRFVSPEDEMSSYGLLERADVIITTGSSLGLEATIRGKPSILWGRRYYEESGAVYWVKSRDELDALLNAWPNLPAKPRWLAEACILYFWGFGIRESDFISIRDGVLVTTDNTPIVASSLRRRRTKSLSSRLHRLLHLAKRR